MKVDIRQILARGLLSQIRKAGPPPCSVPVGKPGFVPAKTVKEAEDRMLKAGVKYPRLGNMTIEYANALTEAVEAAQIGRAHV